MAKSQSGLQQAIGQLLIIGFDGTTMSANLRSMLTRIQPAGVILFARNIASAEQTHELLRDCQSCVSTVLFTCVDMEGGTVDRFRKVIGPSPSAAEVFATGDRKLFRKHGAMIGKACGMMGLNTDLAPVVDLALEDSRTVMTSRAVSADPRKATLYAREFLAGLRSSRVIGSLKHFPGLGGANLDTHKELPNVARTWKQLWSQDLAPYRALRREAPMVLISHAAYPSVTRDRTPASLSRKWITQVLRQKIQYRGLVISDDLEMGGVLKAASVEQAAVEHIRAGGDIGLVCHAEDHVIRSYEALIKESERDNKFATRCQESIARVLVLKRKLRRTSAAPDPTAVQRLSRDLWEFSEHIRLKNLQRQLPAQETA
jgi:beta-N-acetylhexosaminidase